MMRLSLLFLFAGCTIHTSAQDIQQEINEQVWKPFVTTYNNYDTEGFMALHDHDLIRVPRDAAVIHDFEAYRKGNEEDRKWNSEQGARRSIELRFTERIADETKAYEVGIFKVTVHKPGEEARTFYGKFHVVLRKVNGRWKILVDADSSEGNAIGEDDFQKADLMN